MPNHDYLFYEIKFLYFYKENINNLIFLVIWLFFSNNNTALTNDYNDSYN